MPLLVAREARQQGRQVLAAAIRGITDERVDAAVDEVVWLTWGDFPAFLELLQAWQARGVREAVMAGKVEQQRIYERDEGGAMSSMIADLPSGHTDELLGAVAGVLAAADIELLESTRYLQQMIATPGVIGGRAPTAREQQDIEHGWAVAKRLGDLDIGQTVVVKDRAIVAVEGMEGTDACIRRAGALAGTGCVVVKVAKPDQDLRFDVPVVGVGSVETLRQAGATVLAVEAGVTVVFDRQKIEELAAASDLSVIASSDG